MATSLSAVVLGSAAADSADGSWIGTNWQPGEGLVWNRRISRFMLHFVSRSGANALLRQIEWSTWSIWIATGVAVTFSIAQPATRIVSIALDPAELGPGQAAYAALAFACYLPIQIWLVLSLARGNRGWPQWIGLAAMAIVIFAAMPLVGVGWVGMVPMLGAITIVTLRPPWSLVAFGALLAEPTVFTSALGRPDFALYFTMGVLLWAVPMAAVIWMIDVARQLQGARRDLARQAVVRERLRIDRELSNTVGDGLQSIAVSGERASKLASSDPLLAGHELKELVNSARHTLSEARMRVRRYRETSLRAELETAATLLEAAGARVHLDLPSGELLTQDDESERARLRHEITHLLGEAVPTSLTIRVETVDGRVRYRLLLGADRRTPEAAAR